MLGAELKIFTTCPVSTLDKARVCVRRIESVARWSEEAGCEGILVVADNRQLDPWLVARAITGATDHLCPLVTVHPVYAHPYAVAKAVASLGFMYGRRTYLHMSAHGFANGLHALRDTTPQDQRYARLIEYTKVIQELLRNDEPVTVEGAFYQLTDLRLAPALARELQPQIFVSGASDAGRAAALELGATPIERPLVVTTGGEPDRAPGKRGYAVRLGIITDRDEARAWPIAAERFPGGCRGQVTRLPNARVETRWHQALADRYWLAPTFRGEQAMCPYLVGNYDQVAAELARYVEDGCTTFLLDEPANEPEMQQIGFTFELVTDHCVAA